MVSIHGPLGYGPNMLATTPLRSYLCANVLVKAAQLENASDLRAAIMISRRSEGWRAPGLADKASDLEPRAARSDDTSAGRAASERSIVWGHDFAAQMQ